MNDRQKPSIASHTACQHWMLNSNLSLRSNDMVAVATDPVGIKDYWRSDADRQDLQKYL